MIKAFKSSSSRSNRNSSSNKHEIMVACSCSGVVSSALVEQGIAGGVDRQVVAAAILVAEEMSEGPRFAGPDDHAPECTRVCFSGFRFGLAHGRFQLGLREADLNPA